MKASLLALSMLVATAAVAQPVAPQAPVEFEVVPGCLWGKTSGRCVVQNRLDRDISCQIEIGGKTARGVRVGNTRQVVIPAGKFDDGTAVFVAPGDSLVSVRSFAKCRVPAEL